MTASTLEELSELVRARRALPSPAARRAIRVAAGVSLQDVAGVVGVSRQAVQLWERGYTPRPTNLAAYSEALRVLREVE